MINEKLRLAVAKAICAAMEDDWQREGPGDVLMEAYGPLADAAIAALSNHIPDTGQMVPGSTGSAEGWVLVPRVPTDEMLAACDESKPENAKTDAQRRLATRLRDDGRRMRREDWHAMLSALPAPPSAMIDAAGGRDE